MRIAPTSLLLLGVCASAHAAPDGQIELAPKDGESFVVGGTDAAPGVWPDAAGVAFRRGAGPGCTGVLVAPTVVLTAGHCIGGIADVFLNTHDYAEGIGERIDVVQQVPHPSLDVGLLVLSRPSTVQPRVIASGCALDRHLRDGAEVAIVGFGAVDANASQSVSQLQEARSTITDASCQGARGCAVPGQELAAGGNGVDSCNGDSGGPLYLVTEHVDYLIATTSRAQPSNVPCSNGGIYVRSDAILDWISNTTGVSIPAPTCNTPPVASSMLIAVKTASIESFDVDFSDVDENDQHVVRIVSQPANGAADIGDDGRPRYQSNEDFIGDDQFVIEIRDSGVPSLAVSVIVDVEVSEGGGCGCRLDGTGALSAGWPLFIALCLLVRRRRSHRA